MSKSKSQKRLLRLIRRIARETAYEVLDEHLNDYEHKEKPASSFEAEIYRERKANG
jgi:hypothetical protein